MAEKKKAKPRREYGDGSIYQRSSDGRYVGSFYVDGERKSVYGDTRKEAKTKLEAAQQQAAQGTLVASDKRKVSEYLEYWLSVHKLEMEVQTTDNYMYRIALINRTLGLVPLQKLTTAQIQKWIFQMDEDEYAPGTIRFTVTVLQLALADAVKWKLLSFNPCTDATLVKLQQKEMQVFDIEQVQYFLDFLRGHKYEALFVLAVTTGMRRGELLALHWSDIDLEFARLQVRRTLAYIRGRGYVETDPKTKSSRRSISLTQVAIDALKAHRTRQREQRMVAKEWKMPDLVFTRPDGYYLSKQVPDYNIHMIAKHAELPALRFHDLRHTCATLLLQNNVHPKVVQELLGHSSIKITMDLYSHVLPNMQGDAMTGFNSLLTQSVSKKEAFS